jgi:hypothetical protein
VCRFGPLRCPVPLIGITFDGKAVTAALDKLPSLLPDFIERGPELGPSFVNLMELPSRFARWERDEEAAAQAGHLRMTAKPTDGLLVCLAAAGAGKLDLGIIERAFGHDASLLEKPRRIAIADSGKGSARHIYGFTA